MSIFIAVLFVCAQEGCAFLMSDTKFFKKSECQAQVIHAVQGAKEQGITAQGTCLKIELKDLV